MVQVYIPLLGGFWIDQTEVTNAQYALCVQAGSCNPPVKSNFYDLDYFGNSRYSNYPVVYVYWSYANAYCSWAGRRLPTSQEWEAAARGGDNRAYPWGNNRPNGSLANICDVNCTLAELRNKQDASMNDGYSFTAPVGSYPAGASPYGVLDMAGNLWEWTASSLGSYYVIRGGAWTSNWETIQSSHFSSYDPQVAWVDTGFRCAMNK
jgi:serine/threonine-protein kinase